MHPPSRWQRLGDCLLSMEPRRRTRVGMALLAVVLMVCSASVLLLVERGSTPHHFAAMQCWAVVSIAGLLVMTAAIRTGLTQSLKDPSLTMAQMVWTITSSALAYMLATQGRGLVPSVLALILFFGTFSLSIRQVVGIGLYALVSFTCAIAATTRLEATGLDSLDTAYALMVLIVLSGCMALNLRIQRIRGRLSAQHVALNQALEVNRELATRDELTGLLNRRAMQDLMDLELRRSARSSRPFLLAQLDIDHFKSINDRYGHATGDRALQCFAHTVRSTLRDTDVLARWGGEEFVLMMTETDVDGALDLMERVRTTVAALQMEHATGTLRMTVSAGLAPHIPGDSIEHTLERADQALYTAKALGRDRAVVAPAPAPVRLAAAPRSSLRA